MCMKVKVDWRALTSFESIVGEIDNERSTTQVFVRVIDICIKERNTMNHNCFFFNRENEM